MKADRQELKTDTFDKSQIWSSDKLKLIDEPGVL